MEGKGNRRIVDPVDILGNESVQAKAEGTYRNRTEFGIISKEITKSSRKQMCSYPASAIKDVSKACVCAIFHIRV